MLNRYERAFDVLFLLLIGTLIFAPIPKPISFEVLGVTGKEFAIYPLGIGMILMLYVWNRSGKRDILINNSINLESQAFFLNAKWYLGILSLTLALSVISGVLSYPYYEQLLSSVEYLPVRLLHAMEIFHSENISKAGVGLWLIFKGLKNVFFDVFWLFGGSFLIYLWYRNRPTRCFELMIKGIFCSLGIIFLYELIELPYLMGNQMAACILTTINPYIHQIGQLNNSYIGNTNAAVQAYAWWPPLLWKHQVRSVFPEPSFFGMYCAFAVPWLWLIWFRIKKGGLLSAKGVTLSLVMLFLYFLIFATQARTAVLLFMGELVLLAIYVIYRKNSESLKRIMIILLLGSMAFSGSLFFTQIEKNGFSVIMETMNGNLNAKNDKKSNDKKSSVQNEGKHSVSNKDNSSKVKNDMGTLVQNAGKNYISENITSAVGKDKRSNRARISLMEAELKVWMNHPILGVGKGLKAAYIPDKLPSDATKSSEVKMWLDRLHANGALKASFPDVSEYTSRLCEIGLLGCLLYYFPAVYLAYFFLLFLRRSRDNKQYLRIQSLLSFYLISLAGILAGGITTSLNVNYCFGVLLGIGFILHHQVKQLEVAKN